MAQTVVTNGDGAVPGRPIQPHAVHQFNLNAAKEKLNSVLQLLKELNEKSEEQVSWHDVQRLTVINNGLDEILRHYQR